MPRPNPFSRLSTLGLALAVLIVATGASPRTATAQATAFDADKPIQSLRQTAVTAESDSRLADLATALMKARADTKIGHSTYQKGVQYFKLNHPEFYGNFFGNPFYATYDADYFRMARLRYLASLEVNPFQSSLANMFFCDPLSYDPAFGGTCQGFRYVSEFFLVPLRYRTSYRSRGHRGLFASLSRPFPGSLWRHKHFESIGGTAVQGSRRVVDRSNRESRGGPDSELRRRPDTLRTSSNPSADGAEPDLSSAPAPIEVDRPSDPSLHVQLPSDLRATMRAKVSSLVQSEKALRIRQLKEERYGDRDLSARERFEFAVYLNRVLSSGQQTDAPTRTRERSRIHGEYDLSSTLREIRRLKQAVEVNADIGSSPELGTPAHERRGTRGIDAGIDRSDPDRAIGDASGPDVDTPDRNRPAPEVSPGRGSSPKGPGNNPNPEKPSSKKPGSSGEN
ncbi:MAG: hypothetical protein ABEL04_04620 [Salinibacter sp.]|uniref:hypothetical protein n=1 Tax=Salinibacter sp. TaxID=2065818 RepID=UPI0035D4F2BB